MVTIEDNVKRGRNVNALALYSQNNEFPALFLVVDIAPTLDIQKDEELHAFVVFPEPGYIQRCLRQVSVAEPHAKAHKLT